MALQVHLERMSTSFGTTSVGIYLFFFQTLRTYLWLSKPNLFCDPVHVSNDELYMYVSVLRNLSRILSFLETD